MQSAIVYIPVLYLWSFFLSSVAADSQQQAETPQGYRAARKKPDMQKLAHAQTFCRGVGCGWSLVYVYKSNPHRGWIIDLILSTLSMEVKVVLLF